MKLAALIEHSNHHDELFPSLVQKLNADGYFVDIFTTKPNIQRNSLFATKELRYRWVSINPHNDLFKFLSKNKNIYSLFFPFYFSLNKKYDHVLFSSLEPLEHIRKLTWIIDKTKGSWVAHNCGQFLKNDALKYMIKKYTPIVLAPHIQGYLKKNEIDSTLVEPSFIGEIPKEPFEYDFGVQGNFEFSRRNYLGLIKALEQLLPIYPQLKVNFIGKAGKKNIEKFKKIASQPVIDCVTFSSSHFLYKDFYKEIQKCRVLLPLIDEQFREYLTTKTSAVFGIIKGLNKSALIYKPLAESYRLSGDIIFTYEDEDSFLDKINFLMSK